MSITIQTLVENLGLKPHPEGGYYREVYRSAGLIPKATLGGAFTGARNYSTSIYFLLTSDSFSAFHRIRQDEIWHCYMGAPLHVHVIDERGTLTTHTVGLDIENGERPQLVVPAGCWFASGVAKEDAFSLVGCTVSPGFDFDDFELAKGDELTKVYPQHASIISSFTRK